MRKNLVRKLSMLLVLCSIITLTPMAPVQAASKVKIVSSVKKYCAPYYKGEKGTTAQLKVQGIGNKKVTWKSSNTKVATVSSSGLVTVKKLGTATITAKVGKKSYKHRIEAWSHHDFANDSCERCKAKAPSWYVTRADVQKQLKDLVFSTVTPDMSDEEKVAAINDWLWVQPDMTREGLEYKYDEHGQRVPKYCDACDGLAAWNGMGDCMEQAQAFFIMAYAAGLEVRLYYGANHEWTTVKVDGLWYIYDPTRAWVSTELNANPYGGHDLLCPMWSSYDTHTYKDLSRATTQEVEILYRANYITTKQYNDWRYDENPKYPYLTNN